MSNNKGSDQPKPNHTGEAAGQKVGRITDVRRTRTGKENFHHPEPRDEEEDSPRHPSGFLPRRHMSTAQGGCWRLDKKKQNKKQQPTQRPATPNNESR